MNNLTSKKDFAISLMNGDVYRNPENKSCLIYFNESSENPFRFKAEDGSDKPLNYNWNKYWNYELVPKWYDDITNKVLCWVDNNSKSAKNKMAFIEKYDGLYHSEVSWGYATPLTTDELTDLINHTR